MPCGFLAGRNLSPGPGYPLVPGNQVSVDIRLGIPPPQAQWPQVLPTQEGSRRQGVLIRKDRASAAWVSLPSPPWGRRVREELGCLWPLQGHRAWRGEQPCYSRWGQLSYQKCMQQSPFGPFYFPGEEEGGQWWDETGSALCRWGNRPHFTGSQGRPGFSSPPLRPCLLLSAPHRAVARLRWQFGSVILGVPPPPIALLPQGLSTPPCRALGLLSRTYAGMFQSRLPYLPAWGPCHLLLLRYLLPSRKGGRNGAACFLSWGPHLPLVRRQDISLLLGGSIIWSSCCLRGHGLQGGTRGQNMGRKAP